MGSLKEKAKALLQQCEVVTLTSINKEGYPRPVPLSKIKTEGLTTIWFATVTKMWYTGTGAPPMAGKWTSPYMGTTNV